MDTAIDFSRLARLRTVVLGGGDLASGVVYRLHRAGLRPVVTELAQPRFVRRTVCYGEAIYSGSVVVEGIRAVRVDSLDASPARDAVRDGSDDRSRDDICVVVDPYGEQVRQYCPVIIVDARMEKTNPDLQRSQAPVTIALGPGYRAGVDALAVIETMRGHRLGRVIWQGHAIADTGEPGRIGGQSLSRVLRAPADGRVQPRARIGDNIHAGDVVATVAGQPIVAVFDGVVRGLIHPDVPVVQGMKVGDLDPRADASHIDTISDKSLAVGGGVLEAVLVALQSLPTAETHQQGQGA